MKPHEHNADNQGLCHTCGILLNPDWQNLPRNTMTARQSSATDKALALIRRGLTPYAAAKRVGIALSTIYRALKRIRERQ